MMTLIDGIAGPFRTSLWTLFAAVAAVLLVACAEPRQPDARRAHRHDGAIWPCSSRSARRAPASSDRSSSNRSRLVLLEARSVWCSPRWGLSALVALAPAQLPRAGEIRIDTAVLLFSLAVSLLTGLLFGVIPAIVSSRVDVRDALQGEQPRRHRVQAAGSAAALVGAEVALAVTLLVVMTMLARSFANVQAVSPGFDAANLLSARLTLPAARFNTRDAIVTFQRALNEQVLAMPGVTGSAAISLVPLSGSCRGCRSRWREGRSNASACRWRSSGRCRPAISKPRASRCVRGRTFTAADTWEYPGRRRRERCAREAVARRTRSDRLAPAGRRQRRRAASDRDRRCGRQRGAGRARCTAHVGSRT